MAPPRCGETICLHPVLVARPMHQRNQIACTLSTPQTHARANKHACFYQTDAARAVGIHHDTGNALGRSGFGIGRLWTIGIATPVKQKNGRKRALPLGPNNLAERKQALCASV
eukprot:gene5507-7622_t